MSLTDYLVDTLLILIIVVQMRPRRLTARSVLLPVGVLVWVGFSYLRAFTLGGNDLALIAVLTVVGAALGIVSGLLTAVWRDGDTVLARAGFGAAAAWVAGMGFRFGFEVWANTAAGGAELARLSAEHGITSGQAWTTALVLMAFGEVLCRVGVMQLRWVSARRPALVTA